MEPTFLQLKQNSKREIQGLPEYRLSIIADCATQHLAMALKGYAYQEGLGLQIFEAEYNQLDAQVLDQHSELYRSRPQSVLMFMCTEKLYEAFSDAAPEQRAGFADQMMEKIEGYWQQINARTKTNILQFTFVDQDDCVFGNLGLKIMDSFLFQLQKLNFLLSSRCQGYKNVYLISLNHLQMRIGASRFRDSRLYYIAKMPISTEALPVVSKSVIDVVKALLGRLKKCIILDLDNTLWGGVIGDDGLSGIQLGELGLGHAFTDFQVWLRELKNRGIILAVCSKNEEHIAKEPFVSHPDMVLRLEDISLFVANWEDKASNIRFIQQTLNIGMDSIVFLDDNPFERELVRSLIPDIMVPELPEDPALYLSYCRGLNLFETVSHSEEDRHRTEQYRSEAGRVQLQQTFSSYDEYLQNLGMVAVAAPFDPFHYPRIAQLTQRSNQFNLRTIRHTEADVEALAQDPEHLTLYFTLKDRFGDHGLISVVVLDRQEDGVLFISQWLMSCRVLKRGMEEFIINRIMKTAREQGYRRVVGEYLPTPKNAMVAELYGRLGFQPEGAGLFSADVRSFQPHQTYIKEE